ncbi:MAG: alpha/beta hydrolase [Actinomycetota bacterium]|nr:alpha/beta hydrolase [Actinomycetota bacterium]
MRRSLSVAAFTSVVAAVLWAAAPAGAAADKRTAGHGRAAATISWGECSDPLLKAVHAQCGYLSVPLDYAHPSGAQIQIAVSRITHTSDLYQGILLTNPGGPGGSGLHLNTFLIGALQQEGFSAAAAGYDWIGFDPRGVGSSKPALTCNPNYFRADRPNYIPLNIALLTFWLSYSKSYAQACAAVSPQQTALLNHMTTRDAAMDMNRIREALGQRQMTYYGYSYGTYLGQVYSTLFPSHVRRLIMDSNVDPRKIWYQANLNQDIAFNRNENIWLGWLAKYDSVYHLGATKSAVESLFYATKRQLAEHPAGGVVGPDEWLDAFLPAGYFQQTWLGLAKVFSDYINRHSADATNALIAAYQGADSPGNDNGFAVYLAVSCTDTQWPTEWSVWARDNSRVNREAPFFTWGNAWFNAPCIYWPAPAAHPVQINGRGIGNALLIDETLDAATPFTGSLEVRHLFPHSVLLAEPGGTTHADSLAGNLCVDSTIANYLLTGALPPRKPDARWDATCAPLPVPVPTAAASSRAQSSRAAATRAARRAASRLGLPAVTLR